MEAILKNYNQLIQQFQDNKRVVEEYYYFMMMVCVFFHENSLIVTPELYDYIFKLLVQELNDGELGVLDINEEYYKRVRAHSITGEIINMLNNIKDNLNDPTPLAEVILRFKSLEHVFRRGWVIRNVDEEYYESDALHTMQMFAIISMYNNHPNTNNKDDINILKVYEMILIHEITEAIADDKAEIETGYKEHKEYERDCINHIFIEIDCCDYFVKLWQEFEAKETKEARLAYEIDKLDVVLKASFLDKTLNRSDIFPSFYEYEVKRETFENSQVKELFLLSKEQN